MNKKNGLEEIKITPDDLDTYKLLELGLIPINQILNGHVSVSLNEYRQHLQWLAQVKGLDKGIESMPTIKPVFKIQ